MVATYTGRTDGRIARAQASRVQFTDPSNLVTRREYPRVLINLGRNSMSTADPLSHGGDPHVSLDSKCEIGMASLTVAGCRVNAGGRFLSKKKTLEEGGGPQRVVAVSHRDRAGGILPDPWRHEGCVW
jgi:hypothetical protein